MIFDVVVVVLGVVIDDVLFILYVLLLFNVFCEDVIKELMFFYDVLVMVLCSEN